MDGDLFDEFRFKLENEQRHSKHTVEAYCRDVRGFLFYWDEVSRPQFTGQLVNDHLVKLRNAQQEKPSTLNRKRMAIRQFVKWLRDRAALAGEYEEERRLTGQLLLIDPIRAVRKIREVISDDDLHRILAALHGETSLRSRAMILTLHSGGIRSSEMAGLNVGDVLHSSQTLRIMGKGRRERMVRISGDCLKAIQYYAEHWRTRYAVSGTPALFIKVSGQRIGRNLASKLLAKLSARLNVTHTTAHTLRRTLATQLMNAGETIQEVQRVLGHESITSTEQYLALSFGRLQSVYQQCHPREQDDFGAHPQVE